MPYPGSSTYPGSTTYPGTDGTVTTTSSLRLGIGRSFVRTAGTGGGGVTPGPTVQIARSPTSIALSSGSPTANITFTALDANGVATGARVYGVSSDPTITSILPDSPWTATKVGTGTTAVLYGQLTDPGAAPRYTGAAGQTRLYFTDMSDAIYASGIDYLGAVARLSESAGAPFWAPRNSPLIDGTNPVPATQFAIVQGATVGSKALRLRYPPGTASSWELVNNPQVSTNLKWYIRFKVRMSVESGGAFDAFAIKWVLREKTNSVYPRNQLGTHDMSPFQVESESPQPSVKACVWQVYPNGAFTDELGRTDVALTNHAAHAYPVGMDQGTQPIGPYLPDLIDASIHEFVVGFKDHTPATGTVTVSGGVATFSTNQTLVNGDRIRPSTNVGNVAGTGIVLPAAVGTAFVVSAFNGTNSCTLTGCPDLGPCGFAINGDGFAEQWCDGVRHVRVHKSVVGHKPTGGDKQWCGQDMVDAICVGDTTTGGSYVTGPVYLGESRTSGSCVVLLDYLETEIWTEPA